ncbi:MAG: lasso peptide biosynthesis B2 protein [Pyrinomonadaceae bacterium]
MKKIYRFIFYPFGKKTLLIKSLILLWMIRVCLWVFPFKSLNKWLSYLYPATQSGEKTNWEIIGNVSDSVRAVSKYVPYASCLTQALAVRTLLNLRGQDSNLRIGVDKDAAEDFSAHAWIEIDGRIIIGKLPRHHQRFAVLNPSDSVVI